MSKAFIIIGLIITLLSLTKLIIYVIYEKGFPTREVVAVFIGLLFIFTSFATKDNEPELSKEGIMDLLNVKEDINESKYLISVKKQTEELSELLLDLSDLLVNPDPQNEDWIIEVEALLIPIESIVDKGRKLKAPDKFKDSHEYYLKAINEFQLIPDILSNKLNEIDKDLIDQVGVFMSNGTNYLMQSIEQTD